jgi:hypothetical protein
MNAAGYESWFLSARDPDAPRALWIRRTLLRPAPGPATAALWCTVLDPALGPQPVVIKEVFPAFPPGTVAGPSRFAGSADLDGRHARWDLSVASDLPPLRPLRPERLYRAPLPRTKLEASVPDGLVSGVLEVDGHQLALDRWRGTVGHNWGTEHADSWVWLHAAGFPDAPDSWLDLVLARIKVGPARSPWTAFGGLGLDGQTVLLGGLGRRPSVSANSRRLTAAVPSAHGRLFLTVTAADDDAATVTYADPGGGDRLVTHAARATVRLSFRHGGHDERTVVGTCAAYEHATSEHPSYLVPRPLPAG